jgi:hypothetical protein
VQIILSTWQFKFKYASSEKHLQAWLGAVSGLPAIAPGILDEVLFPISDFGQITMQHWQARNFTDESTVTYMRGEHGQLTKVRHESEHLKIKGAPQNIETGLWYAKVSQHFPEPGGSRRLGGANICSFVSAEWLRSMLMNSGKESLDETICNVRYEWRTDYPPIGGFKSRGIFGSAITNAPKTFGVSRKVANTDVVKQYISLQLIPLFVDGDISRICDALAELIFDQNPIKREDYRSGNLIEFKSQEFGVMMGGNGHTTALLIKPSYKTFVDKPTRYQLEMVYFDPQYYSFAMLNKECAPEFYIPKDCLGRGAVLATFSLLTTSEQILTDSVNKFLREYVLDRFKRGIAEGQLQLELVQLKEKAEISAANAGAAAAVNVTPLDEDWQGVGDEDMFSDEGAAAAAAVPTRTPTPIIDLKGGDEVSQRLLPAVRILNKLARFSKVEITDQAVRESLRMTQAEFQNDFEPQHFARIKTYLGASRVTFSDKIHRPREQGDMSSEDLKKFYLFLAGYFLSELAKLGDQDENVIFWSIYYAHAENVAETQRANFVQGAIPEVIATFGLYQYLISEQAQHCTQYKEIAGNVSVLPVNYRYLAGAVFGETKPVDAGHQIQAIHQQILAFSLARSS